MPFSEIDRVLGAAGALVLQVSLTGEQETGEKEWTAFLSVGAEHAGTIERALGDGGPGSQALKDYLTASGTFFPMSRGACRTPVQALQSLNDLLAEIPDRSVQPWTKQVMAATLHMYRCLSTDPVTRSVDSCVSIGFADSGAKELLADRKVSHDFRATMTPLHFA